MLRDGQSLIYDGKEIHSFNVDGITKITVVGEIDVRVLGIGNALLHVSLYNSFKRS